MPQLQIEAPPFATPMVEKDGLIQENWNRWYQLILMNRLQQATPAIVSSALAAQNASIGTTALIAAAAAGLYRVSYYLRVVQAGTVSSSLAVSVATVDGAITITQTDAAYTGNNVALPQRGSFLVRADNGSPISYTTTYASVGATPMLYDLTFVVEQVI